MQTTINQVLVSPATVSKDTYNLGEQVPGTSPGKKGPSQFVGSNGSKFHTKDLFHGTKDGSITIVD